MAPVSAEPEERNHVTQTLACGSCRGFACRGRVGADVRLCLGRSWLARWLAWRRLGRSPLFRRRPGLLWLRLRRLLCATIGPDAVGSPLAPGESLLLTANRRSVTSKAPAPCHARGFFFEFNRGNPPQHSLNFYYKCINQPAR